MKEQEVRESKSNLVKEIMGLIDNTNIDVLTENSNKQSQLASTQRDLIAGEVRIHSQNDNDTKTFNGCTLSRNYKNP